MKFFQVLVLIFGLGVFTNAQKAILSGTVTDKFGSVIPGAKVFALNEKGEKFETITNAEGNYVLNLLFNSVDKKRLLILRQQNMK